MAKICLVNCNNSPKDTKYVAERYERDDNIQIYTYTGIYFINMKDIKRWKQA